MNDTPWHQTISLPALLRFARQPYGTAMRGALDAAGYDDLPPNGLYVVGALALRREGIAIGQLARALGMAKQAASQLIDTLVLRGYVARQPDPADRRQTTVTLTERGQAAADIQRSAREALDASLAARVGDAALATTRATLVALVELGHGTAGNNDDDD